jgi:hypothetical protein
VGNFVCNFGYFYFATNNECKANGSRSIESKDIVNNKFLQLLKEIGENNIDSSIDNNTPHLMGSVKNKKHIDIFLFRSTKILNGDLQGDVAFINLAKKDDIINFINKSNYFKTVFTLSFDKDIDLIPIEKIKNHKPFDMVQKPIKNIKIINLSTILIIILLLIFSLIYYNSQHKVNSVKSINKKTFTTTIKQKNSLDINNIDPSINKINITDHLDYGQTNEHSQSDNNSINKIPKNKNEKIESLNINKIMNKDFIKFN